MGGQNNAPPEACERRRTIYMHSINLFMIDSNSATINMIAAMISLSTVLLQYVRTYRGRLLYMYLQILRMCKSNYSVFPEQAKKGRLYLTVLRAAASGGVYGVQALRFVRLANNLCNSCCFSLYILTSLSNLAA